MSALVPGARLLRELRGGTKLLGKLYRLPDGRRVVELACRGHDCQGQRRCWFDVRTGDRLPAETMPERRDRPVAGHDADG